MMPGMVPSVGAASWIGRGGIVKPIQTATAATRAAVISTSFFTEIYRPAELLSAAALSVRSQ